MDDTKLTVRVSRHLLDNAKQYALQNHTTLTRLIESYLRRLPAQRFVEDAPIVGRLTGVLSPDITLQDYKEHLEEKYDQ